MVSEIKRLIKKFGSRAAVADALGLTQQQVRNIEKTGKTSGPTTRLIYILLLRAD